MKLTSVERIARSQLISSVVRTWESSPGEWVSGWRMPMDAAQLREFGKSYTFAWCSQNAASVAAFFAEGGSLQINEGTPSVGRAAITAAAQGFMTTFPDMVVTMDDVDVQVDHAVYRWTLTGTNTGPGGTGKAVRISGHEVWRIGSDGLIGECPTLC